MKKIALFLFISTITMHSLCAQQTITLYDGAVPNSKPYNTKEWWEPRETGDTIVHFTSQPTLTIFLPEKNCHRHCCSYLPRRWLLDNIYCERRFCNSEGI